MQNVLIENYSISPSVKWSVETYHILLWDPSGNVQIVEYPQAAIWDFVTRQYYPHDIINKLSFITDRTEQENKSLYNQTINEWIHNGILIKSTGTS